jgi:hypothetical protein
MAFDLSNLNAAVTALTAWVKAGLAKKADAAATTTALAAKANASDLTTTNQNVSNLTTTVGTKANASDLTTTNQNVTNLTNTVNGKQNTVLTGTAVPANTLGNDGDVYLLTDS